MKYALYGDTLTNFKKRPPVSGYLSHLQAVVDMYGGGEVPPAHAFIIFFSHLSFVYISSNSKLPGFNPRH